MLKSHGRGRGCGRQKYSPPNSQGGLTQVVLYVFNGSINCYYCFNQEYESDIYQPLDCESTI